jgi:N-acetylmuramoyl-L-alanine amidase
MLKKTIVVFLSIPFIALLFSFDRPAKQAELKQQVLRTVIIDAGHGIMPNGGYNGAKGTYSHEDDICLAVAKKLVALMGQDFPGVKIVETRPTKYITTLHDRADIANQNKGDLFISIHVNAMPDIEKREFLGYKTETYYTGKGKKRKKHTRKVAQYRYYHVPNTTEKGTQTYIWGAHKSEDKEIAVRENAPILSEENYQKNYGDIDVNSPEFVALSLVKTQQFARRSTTLANMVEEQFAKVGRISGGAHQRQVGIWVLQATAMPSVLVETGFITNPQEEEYLNSENGQDEIAKCISEAVKNYKVWLEKKQITTDGNSQAPVNNNNNSSKSPYAFLEGIEKKEKAKAK